MNLARLERDGVIATLTLDAPPANAFSRGLVETIGGHIDTLSMDDELRAVIVTGAGEKAFSAGADLKERSMMTADEVRTFVPHLQTLLDRIAHLPMPTIAAINGVAFGGGLELALVCDLRIAASHAQMGLTETSLGIIPGAGGTARLPRLVGVARAKELILSARRIDADEALRIGLVHEVVAPADLLAAARTLADRIAANGPLAVRAAKDAIDRGFGLPLEQALAVERECYDRIVDSEDRLEGLAAFSEKRPPDYRSR